jgi:hypothetical protein
VEREDSAPPARDSDVVLVAAEWLDDPATLVDRRRIRKSPLG